MSEAEKLPKNQPAEIHVDGIPLYAGEISATLDQGLLLSESRPMRGKQKGPTIDVDPGAEGDLIFKELFDDEGTALIVPVTIVSAEGTDISIGFRDQASATTLTALEKLKAKPRKSVPSREQGGVVDSAILPELRKKSLRQLDKILNDFLMAMADYLFDMSGRPQNKDRQEDYYETMNVIKGSRDKLRKSFAKEIEGFFDNPVKGAADKSPQEDDDRGTELNLVDIKDFEDSLSLNRMIRMGQDKYALPLECLTLRFSDLTDIEPLDVRLPLHVAQICQAFKATVSSRIAHDVAPDVYGFFSDQVIRNLDAFYASLNAFLREKGIRTEVEDEIKRSGSILKRLDAEKKAAETPNKPEPAAAEKNQAKDAKPSGDNVPSIEEAADLLQEARDAGVGRKGENKENPERFTDELVDAIKQQFNPDDLYRSVIDALNFRRETGADGSPQGDAPLGFGRSGNGEPVDESNMAGPSALASALNALQGDQQVRTQLHEQPSLRKYLDQNQSSISELDGTEGIKSDSLNQIDLVDNLFTDLSTEVDVTPDLKPSIGDLQIPLAKLALLEPQFFANRSHPARGVIDKVAKLSSSANYPNKALETRVTGIVENIVDNYKEDSGVFQSALQELEKLSELQQKSLERNVERVVKTQDGQQKLQKAQAAVEKVLRSRVRPPNAPKPIVELVDNGWRDMLTLAHVKEGPHSKAWKDYVKTLDLLSLWLIEQQRGGVSEQVQVERALEAEPFIDMIRQQVSEALPTNVAHEAVLDDLQEVLSGRAELQLAPVEYPAEDTTPAPDEVRKKVETLPRLRRWVKRVEDLEQGNWLSYRDKAGARRRMQLAWISEQGDRFIFVNERGQKVSELSAIELARQLSRGVKPPSASEDLPLVDQSMYKTLEHVQKSLSFDKNHDGLTKLINRETFLNQVDVALKHAKTKHANHALLYIDIDQFKLVNDVYDDLTGDQVLVEFAKLLSQHHSKKISSARLESDKFAVLLLDRSMDEAADHAERMRSDIENSPVAIENDKVSFTVSIGVCAILDFSASVDEVMEHGALAVLKAKEDGRNNVARYHEEQKREVEYRAEEAATIAQIEKTLDSKNFVLQAQPIAHTKPAPGQEPVEHFEILLSIADDEGVLHSPQEFIISAERFGFMTQVDRWVVKQVFTWISKMMDEQKVVPNLAINLSGNSITDDNFMEYLFEQISEFGVGTSKICFEITETGTIANMVKAIDFVNEFKNIGCKFSIDDFGTGLASHSYLRDLPVDYVKIDGSFVADIHNNPRDYAMTKSINDLAHFLGQETIAEFAESEAVIEKLREIGVDYIQGWGVGRPTPLTTLSGELDMIEK
jgi:diguanylate cyclase (GGDEF)-like protein